MRALLTSVATKVENAIEIAFNPTSDPSLKSQALQFLDQLRSEPQIWQVCLSFVVREPQPSEVVRHVALDIINDAIRGGQLDPLNLAVLRDNLMMHVQKVYGANGISSLQIDPPNIQNKISQTLTYLFKLLYSTDWSSFFHDMLGLTVTAGSVARDNAPGVRFYLRILNSVHDEIADILVPKSTGEQRKDTDLKDLVRQRDAKMIVLSWQEILSQWRLKDDFIVAQCLAVIKRWVAWTDISLVIDAPILNILFELVSPPRTANEPNSMFITTETFVEIIGKKMGADDKLELISILRIKEVVSQLIQSAPLLDQRFTPLYDTDVAESAAKLVNTTVSDIVRALESAQDGTSLSIRAMNQLNEFLPYVLRFFSDEYDEICSTVIPCMTDLLTLFRRKAKAESAFYSENASILPSMLDAVIAKMKYDETSSWGNEDAQADEAEFQDLRKRLQVLQQAIAAVNKDLYIDSISKLIIGTFDKYHSHGGQVDWRDVELAMHELFLFGELALKGGGLYSKTKPVSTAAERLIEMMAKLINSSNFLG
jgi:exportin-T